MPESTELKLVECPRDAMQGCPKLIPAATKAEVLRRLISAGFRHIDAVSFVSTKAVPQMADSEQVLELLGRVPNDVELVGIVLNERGVERAAATTVTTVGYPYSVSPTFQYSNANQSSAQALETLRAIKAAADTSKLKTIAYISMAFGNPYGDAWTPEMVRNAVAAIAVLGIREFALADTVGLADESTIRSVYSLVAADFPQLEIGLHLHSRPEAAASKVRAGFQAGCRRFDTALTGMGGCPFAGDHLVGNIPTEVAVQELASSGARTGVQVEQLAPAVALVKSVRQEYGCA